MSQADVARILALPVEERLHLMSLIWESLNKERAEIPMSDEERELIAERLAEHERDPDDVVSLDELHAYVRRQ